MIWIKSECSQSDPSSLKTFLTHQLQNVLNDSESEESDKSDSDAFRELLMSWCWRQDLKCTDHSHRKNASSDAASQKHQYDVWSVQQSVQQWVCK